MRVHELHAPVKVVQRSKGRSAVAAAAYRSGQRLVDERTGLVHDYTRKQGIEADALLLPANAPDWAHDRQRLWSEAELRENHPRAQTARELTVAFPSEFNPEHRREAGLRIGEWIVARYGSAVDIAWHEPSRDGDQRNHHAHFLFTTRRFDENGEWSKTKDRTLDDLKKGPDEIIAIRLGVADTLNNIAVREKLEVYIEHLSFERRGLDREATQHLGPIATDMERDGVETDIGKKNRDIKARNAERQKLHEQQKVVDIEIAREQLRLKKEQEQKNKTQPELPREPKSQPQADPFPAFYQDTQERRAAMLKELTRQHGDREKQLRQNIAGLIDVLENAGFLSRAWRGITGQASADRKRLADAQREMEDIQRQKQTLQEKFERDRQQRLEDLQEGERLKEQQREAAAREAMPRAVGDVPRAREGPAPVQASSQPQAALPPSPAPANDQAARRRDYFRRTGTQRKVEREREAAAAPTPPQQPDKPSPAFEQAGKPSTDPVSDREARKAEYRRQINERRERNQERNRGPGRER